MRVALLWLGPGESFRLSGSKLLWAVPEPARWFGSGQLVAVAAVLPSQC
jgi:hypothetical protein